jgi:phosphatidylinositol-3-phosphatase
MRFPILPRRPRLVLSAAAVLVLPLTLLAANPASATATHETSAAPAAARAAKLPPIRHVWVIDLENEGVVQSFDDPAADPYLAVTLRDDGAYLANYYGIGHDSADNYIAQISGQAPDTQTQNDCEVWNAFEPTNDVVTPYHQLKGNGCAYPASVPTLGNQLSQAGQTWRAYLQDMGNDPARPHHADRPGTRLWSPRGRRPRPDRGRRGRRPVRHPARGLHVLRVRDR